MNVCPGEGVAYDSYYNETDRVIYSHFRREFRNEFSRSQVCTHTNIVPGNWWVVDLGGNFTIGRVTLTNRSVAGKDILYCYFFQKT